ncbi:hypothetical protein SLA2020_445950 [Shorea laevis]
MNKTNLSTNFRTCRFWEEVAAGRRRRRMTGGDAGTSRRRATERPGSDRSGRSRTCRYWEESCSSPAENDQRRERERADSSMTESDR